MTLYRWVRPFSGKTALERQIPGGYYYEIGNLTKRGDKHYTIFLGGHPCILFKGRYLDAKLVLLTKARMTNA